MERETGIIGKSYFEILPELGSQGIYEKLLEVLETGEPYTARNSRVDLLIGGKLEPHYFNYTFTPLRNGEGRVYGVMNTGADVTDICLSRQQNAEAEEKLRLALHSASLCTYEIDLMTSQVTVSEGFREMWDIHGPLTKEVIVSRIHPDDIPVRENALAATGNDGRVSYETRIIHRDGALKWLRLNGKIISDTSGQQSVMVGIAQDITSQKLSEEHLTELVEKRTAQLRRSNDDLLQFSQMVSHDLKEPVRKIKIFGSMLRGSEREALREAYLDKIDQAGERMLSMIDGILTYSSTTALGFPVEPTGLNTIIKSIKKDLELMIDEKKAIFIEEHLPAIQGSSILLQRLFYNLVSNSLKFSKPDAPPRVRISWVPVERSGVGYVRILVEDNGIGIAPKDCDKIFNAFERLHSKDQFEGTGLGLALCKKITARHAGAIEVSSLGAGLGSAFAVELPLVISQQFI